MRNIGLYFSFLMLFLSVLVVSMIVVVVQTPSCVQHFVTPWTAACQASLSLTSSRSLPKVMSISDAVQPSHPLTPSSPSALRLSQHQGLFK